MEAFDIMDKKFDKGFNGYKMEDVDQFLQEISAEFGNLKKQNQDLEKKMEVLADKIKEYRNDEDAIKEALLGAQKQSSEVKAAAKEKSEKMIAEAKEKAEKMIKEAEDNVAEKDAYAKKLVEDANAEKTRIIAECERKSAEIKAEMEAEVRKLESIIAKTRDESHAYLERLMKSYQEHIDFIKAIPDKCENEFVRLKKDTLVIEEPKVEEKIEEKKEEVKQEAPVKKKPEKIFFEKTSEIASKPAFELDNGDDDSDDEEEEKPVFEKKKGKSKFEKLQFGNNNKNKE
ncbi:MAG: DivIVA domain-containing protein [Firmicutes bacterium]|nr:DivIVA domain-containing protein [[Eubacterium] siraeum]MCM1486911.1 DivIVA domain-containing protein [Bacillota bacterium]